MLKRIVVALLIAATVANADTTYRKAVLRGGVFGRPTAGVTGFSLPLKITASGRYLENQAGNAQLILGDAAWSMIANLTYAQANTYLTDRAARGVNLVQVNLIEKYFSNQAPNNVNGQPPFTGTAFATPNDLYFALADSMIDRANALGITVLLDVAYFGSPSTQGWIDELRTASTSDVTTYGDYLALHYKNRPNVIFMFGTDCGVCYTAYPTAAANIQTIISRIKAVDPYLSSRIYTYEGSRGSIANSLVSDSWLTLNNTYTGAAANDHYTYNASAYAVSPVKPFILIEGSYENEGGYSSSAQGLRSQFYATILAGGCGHIFGNNPIWDFNSTPNGVRPSWTTYLNSTGIQDMTRGVSVFTSSSRKWWLLVPDVANAVMTSGASTGGPICAKASDGSMIMAYLPSATTVTVTSAALTAASHTWKWYDPTTGTYTTIGTYAKGPQTITSPGERVLVIE